MDLDANSWYRLIDGLTEFTKNGRMVWNESFETGIGQLFSTSKFGRTFTSQNKKHRYTLSGGMFGIMPIEFIVTEVGVKNPKTVAHYRSDRQVSYSTDVIITQKLVDLYTTVASKVIPPEQTVNNLLEEF